MMSRASAIGQSVGKRDVCRGIGRRGFLKEWSPRSWGDVGGRGHDRGLDVHVGMKSSCGCKSNLAAR
jgi:hypothetical protein